MTLALKAWGQRLSKRTGAKRPKCSRATQIQASLMSHVGQSGQRWLHRICPLMALSRHALLRRTCPLSGVSDAVDEFRAFCKKEGIEHSWDSWI
jgi:hypothetical protein